VCIGLEATDLSSREIVASGKSRGPSVQCRLAIPYSTLGKMWEREKTWLLWLTLLLEILRIHCGQWGWMNWWYREGVQIVQGSAAVLGHGVKIVSGQRNAERWDVGFGYQRYASR
jgi:hypothetical protein